MNDPLRLILREQLALFERLSPSGYRALERLSQRRMPVPVMTRRTIMSHLEKMADAAAQGKDLAAMQHALDAEHAALSAVRS